MEITVLVASVLCSHDRNLSVIIGGDPHCEVTSVAWVMVVGLIEIVEVVLQNMYFISSVRK